MGSVRWLLAVGNGKLGQQIAHFDLPAVSTCPGRTPTCERVCYATRSRFRFANVQARLWWCYKQSRRKDFVRRVVREIRIRGLLVVRLHVSGDFYAAGYARKWLQIMRQLPRVRFYFYSRSWRIAAIARVLEEMTTLCQTRVWYSVDADSGLPSAIPQGVRLAWLQDSPQRPQGAQLVFRTRRMLGAPRVGLPLICPTDTPAGRRNGETCGSCGLCWRE